MTSSRFLIITFPRGGPLRAHGILGTACSILDSIKKRRDDNHEDRISSIDMYLDALSTYEPWVDCHTFVSFYRPHTQITKSIYWYEWCSILASPGGKTQRTSKNIQQYYTL